MSVFNVASRFEDAYKNEVCPVCGRLWEDFMIIPASTIYLRRMEGVEFLGCYTCGTIFVPKELRGKEFLGKKDQLLSQKPENECDICKRVCKSHAGLIAHRRSHDNAVA